MNPVQEFDMRRLLPFLALLAATSASAADLPLKAAPKPAPVVCSLTQCNVWFIGPSIMGIGSNLDIIGQGIDNSVFANGGYVALTGGAQYWMNGMFLGVENMGGWAFGSPASVNGGSVTTQGGLDVLWFEAGGSLGDFFGSGAQPVQINNALASDLISLYFGTGPALPFGNSSLGTQSFWTSGAGARYLLPAAHPMMIDVKYIYGNNQNTTGLAANKNVQLVGVSLLVPFAY
jgi:hypothetical protein